MRPTSPGGVVELHLEVIRVEFPNLSRSLIILMMEPVKGHRDDNSENRDLVSEHGREVLLLDQTLVLGVVGGEESQYYILPSTNRFVLVFEFLQHVFIGLHQHP